MNSKALARRYDRAAGGWTLRMAAMGYDAAYREFARLAVTLLPLPQSVCDIGCGSGNLSAAVLTEAGGRQPVLTLVDPSCRMLEQAVGRCAQRGVAAQFQHTTLAGARGRFEWVIAAHVIEHCPDPAEAFADLTALTQCGGAVLLIISRPHWCQWLIWPLWRHRWFAQGQVLRWAGAAGWTHILTHSFSAGPPSRTSLGYIFTVPHNPKDTAC
jgi:2-polyprenyl-3-methyl-5-hydroxy-6-metoxy-1,4-benzoquinol methylase